jgi:hypothetical protein
MLMLLQLLLLCLQCRSCSLLLLLWHGLLGGCQRLQQLLQQLQLLAHLLTLSSGCLLQQLPCLVNFAQQHMLQAA